MVSKAEKEKVLQECGFELATNFNCPAETIMAFYGRKIDFSPKEMQKALFDRAEKLGKW